MCGSITRNDEKGEADMPIYDPKDYQEVIARIQKKILEKNINMGECLSEEVITAFEKNCKIQLPQAYRMFLKYVGNGCHHHDFHLTALENIEQTDLSHPFALEKAWIWEDDEGDDEVVEEEINTKVYQGEIELIDFGCCDYFNLIITGKCRGEVWNFTDVGVQPCCERQDFLGWFELWLDSQEETNYFKDYVYDEVTSM